MEYARVPQDCIKATQVWSKEQEDIEAPKSLSCISRHATPADIAKMQPRSTLTYDICAEMGLARKKEKKPEYPFELGLTKAERSQNNA